MLAISASIIFLVSMKVVIHIKILFTKEWKLKWMWYILVIQICWFLILEAVYVSTVIMNFLVPLAPFLTETVTLKAVLVYAYFAFVTALTIPKIRQMPHF
jgi:hypothetical protein